MACTYTYYKKKRRTRSYGDYTPDELNECLDAVKNGLPQRIAAAKYGISRSTIQNKLHGNHSNSVGRPPVFSEIEEKCFVAYMVKMADFNFPINKLDFRMFVKNYLDRQCRVVQCFANNTPGTDFVKGFLKRHRELSLRFRSNASRGRVKIEEKDLTDYIDHLTVTLDGIPPSNIFNYDEINLRDDPGRKRVICRRNAKYVERYCNRSKNATSVMFCGNADGTHFLPPYVIYRSERMWDKWKNGGPTGTTYNRTKHGWFKAICFEDWFEFHFLPNIRHCTGRVVVIGDNLASHITDRVLDLCEQRDIKFACLPPNSTHIFQPLHVAVYRPLKRYWRMILNEWKESDEGRRVQVLPKTMFPVLLKRLFNIIMLTIQENLISGFRKCGIYPLSKEEIYSRLFSRYSYTAHRHK